MRAEILAHAWNYDIQRFCCNSVQQSSWRTVEEITGPDDRVLPFFGVHPWYADKVKGGWDKELERVLKHRASGVGEIGLDKVREGVNFKKQIEVFRRQLQIAAQLSKPVSVHCVKAWEDLLKALGGDFSGKARFMIHSYHGSSETLREVLKLGAYISFSWKWLRGETPDMMELVRQVPDDRLLLETDFPYTEPGQVGKGLSADQYFKCLCESYRIVAAARKVEGSFLEEMVWENGKTFLSGAFARQSEG